MEKDWQQVLSKYTNTWYENMWYHDLESCKNQGLNLFLESFHYYKILKENNYEKDIISHPEK